MDQTARSKWTEEAAKDKERFNQENAAYLAKKQSESLKVDIASPGEMRETGNKVENDYIITDTNFVKWLPKVNILPNTSRGGEILTPKVLILVLFTPQKFFPNKIFPFKMQIEIESEKYRENFILPYQKVWSQSQVHEESNKPHFNPQHYDLVFSIW